MKIKIIFGLFLFAMQVSCVQSSTKKGQVSPKTSDQLNIESFSELPDEIDGCSCYFSNDSNDFKSEKYIYVNDFADISFMKINGEMVKFKLTKYSKIDSLTSEAHATEGEYELTLRITKGIETGEETQLQTGTLILKTKQGKKIVKSFYGECGC